jgi:DNA-binding PadR family transcriptional regulator
MVRNANAKDKDDAELDDFGRFSEPALLILVSLAEGPRHGYAMTEDIETIAGVRLGPGTLYGALARLEARGLIEPMKSEDRRNPYRLTAVGERALRARLDSMMAVARTGQRRLAHA